MSALITSANKIPSGALRLSVFCSAMERATRDPPGQWLITLIVRCARRFSDPFVHLSEYVAPDLASPSGVTRARARRLARVPMSPARASPAPPRAARLPARGVGRSPRPPPRRVPTPRASTSPPSSSSSSSSSSGVAVSTWAGGGSGLVAPPDEPALSRLAERWEATPWNLEARWGLTERLWALERDRAGLDETRWKLGWCATKSYGGITYMWGDPGAERGEIFLSKYLMLDPSFTNALGCLRHELAHALVGPDEDHGPAWAAAARAMETPNDWATDTTRGFYARPDVVLGWSAHDVNAAVGRAFKLPPEKFEKNVWPGDGTRTVFTDQEGNEVM